MTFFDAPPPAPACQVAVKGRLTGWDDGKGFGWIETDGRRYFAHIKEFGRGQRRPATGELVTFFAGVDGKGRPCAKGIIFVRPGGRIGIGVPVALMCLLVMPLLALSRLPFPWWCGPCWILAASTVTYAMYADDKRGARDSRWRIPESQLHLMELLGGWPGGWIAQRRLRHKVVKPSYQFVFWTIVVLTQFASADVLTGGKALRGALGWVSGSASQASGAAPGT